VGLRLTGATTEENAFSVRKKKPKKRATGLSRKDLQIWGKPYHEMAHRLFKRVKKGFERAWKDREELFSIPRKKKRQIRDYSADKKKAKSTVNVGKPGKKNLEQ